MSTSAPAMQPILVMQTTDAMKCTACTGSAGRTRRARITTGITKQSRSYGRQGGKQ